MNSLILDKFQIFSRDTAVSKAKSCYKTAVYVGNGSNLHEVTKLHEIKKTEKHI